MPVLVPKSIARKLTQWSVDSTLETTSHNLSAAIELLERGLRTWDDRSHVVEQLPRRVNDDLHAKLFRRSVSDPGGWCLVFTPGSLAHRSENGLDRLHAVFLFRESWITELMKPKAALAFAGRLPRRGEASSREADRLPTVPSAFEPRKQPLDSRDSTASRADSASESSVASEHSIQVDGATGDLHARPESESVQEPPLPAKDLHETAPTESASVFRVNRGSAIKLYMSGAPQRKSSLTQPNREKGLVPVWFGTDRARSSTKTGRDVFQNRRGSAVTYGRCLVHIPISHRVGSIGSSWLRRTLTGIDDRVALVDTTVLERGAFWDDVRGHLSSVPSNLRTALIFVHGYNVTFDAAIKRAAQLGFDLGACGLTAAYSWPSGGRYSKYSHDESTVEVSIKHLDSFVQDFVDESGAERVHVIAHSMGNRALFGAVRDWAVRQSAHNQPARLGQCILAAADIDSALLVQGTSAYRRIAERTTLYVSRKDLAVRLSQWFHGYPRAGFTPPVTILDGIDTVDVSNLDMTMLGHGYVAEMREVLTDIHGLLTRGDEPSKRFALQRTVDSDTGNGYWRVRT